MKSQEKSKKIKILAVSDTHQDFDYLNRIAEKQEGDIFIHAGDFTFYGEEHYFHKFFAILDKLKFKHKIVISGNHEISLDNGCIEPQLKERYLKKHRCSLKKEELVTLLKQKCHYLEHQAIQLEGIKFFGSPYTKKYCGSAFQFALNYQKDIWNSIPNDVDVLITHSPPYGILDETVKNIKAGSEYLTEIVMKRKPKIHIFGHIHEAKGTLKQDNITYSNVARNPTIFYY